MLMPWDMPPHRLANVDPATSKPSRNWVWYVDRTVKTCAGIAIACVIIAYVMTL